MRESIGTAWIMTIVAAFIALFSSFLAFSVNYSKSFRVKNGIIERINKYNGFSGNLDTGAIKDINDFLTQINYTSRGNCYKFFNVESTEGSYQYAGINVNEVAVLNASTKDRNFNYCVMKVSKNQSGRADITSSYYKIIVFYSLQIGNITLGSQFKTTGETNTLYYPNDIFSNDNDYDDW